MKKMNAVKVSYPTDLDDRIKKYLEEQEEKWDECKHHIYIQNTQGTELLVIAEWRYKCDAPTPKQLDIPKLKIRIRK